MFSTSDSEPFLKKPIFLSFFSKIPNKKGKLCNLSDLKKNGLLKIKFEHWGQPTRKLHNLPFCCKFIRILSSKQLLKVGKSKSNQFKLEVFYKHWQTERKAHSQKTKIIGQRHIWDYLKRKRMGEDYK